MEETVGGGAGLGVWRILQEGDAWSCASQLVLGPRAKREKGWIMSINLKAIPISRSEVWGWGRGFSWHRQQEERENFRGCGGGTIGFRNDSEEEAVRGVRASQLGNLRNERLTPSFWRKLEPSTSTF